GASGPLHAVLQHGLVDALPVEALSAEGRYERRVDVEDAPQEVIGDDEQLHEPRQADKVGPGPAAVLEQLAAELFTAGALLALDDGGGNAGPLRPLQAEGVGAVGGDEHHASGEPAIGDAIEEIL